jgi:hypothetical protein
LKPADSKLLVAHLRSQVAAKPKSAGRFHSLDGLDDVEMVDILEEDSREAAMLHLKAKDD